MTKTTVTFEGLTVFHRDQAGLYEVGILDASRVPHVPPHIFQIAITPKPHSHTGQLILGPADLDLYLQEGNEWFLEVVDTGGGSLKGIQVDAGRPNRHDADHANTRYGWIVNLESSEFHGGRLFRQPGKLKPVIHLNKGSLYTFCKTDSVDRLKGNVPQGDFGFIAASVGFDIDTSAGEEVVLRVGGTEIFRLFKGFSYTVEITKTASDATMNNHFHSYYDALFTKVDPTDRFDFRAQAHPQPSPNRCLMSGAAMEMDTKLDIMKSPPPYKCGGVGVDDGGDPLG